MFTETYWEHANNEPVVPKKTLQSNNFIFDD